MPITDRNVADRLRDVIAGRWATGQKEIARRGGCCWDAVIEVGSVAGLYDEAQAKRIRRITSGTSYTHLVNPNAHPGVGTAVQMQAVPPGHVLAFFYAQPRILSHVMLSLGQGCAAGINNNIECKMLMGSGGAWAIFNIAEEFQRPRDLNFGANPASRWQATHFLMSTGESRYLHHRPITDLALVQPPLSWRQL